jgi:hypothetical protein
MLLVALLLAAVPPQPPLAPLMGPLTQPAPAFNPLGKGSTAVSFGLPGEVSQATVGVTYLLADNLAARVDFGLDAILSPSGQPATFTIGLGLRWYNWKRGPVAIFLSPSFAFGRDLVPATIITTNAGTAGAKGAEFISFGGAVGAEYFFTEHLSAGGTLGLSLMLNNIGGVLGTSVVTQLSTRHLRAIRELLFLR